MTKQLRRIGCHVVTVICIVLGRYGTADAQAVDIFSPDANDYVHAVAAQPDGKILVGGDFTAFGCRPGCGPGSITRNYIARLNIDGSIDATFNPGASSPVWGIVVQPDGKILAIGQFTTVGGGTGTATARKFLARFNADGTVDGGFTPPTDINLPPLAVALQPDGKIVIGGQFTVLSGNDHFFLARLNINGTVDTGFVTSAESHVYTLALQPDGKILVGGSFTGLGGAFGDTPRSNIGRLNTDGSVDAGFDPGADGLVEAIAVQADGKILAGGDFLGLGGGTGTTPRARIGRLDAAGAVEAGFDPGADNTVETFAVQTDGKILVGGNFQLMGGGGSGNTTRNFIGRLNSNGSLDVAFDPGAVSTVYGLAIQADGKVLVGGSFGGLGGSTGTTARWFIGRLWNSAPATQSITVTGGGSIVTWLRGGTSPEVTRVEFASSTDGVNYALLGVGTRIAGGWQLTGLSLPSNPNLTVRARGFYATGDKSTSASIVQAIAPPSNTNLVENGNFSGGTPPWQTFATPDLTYIAANVVGGVMQYSRNPPPPGTSNQATVFQETGVAIPSGAPLLAQFDLGNTSNVRKYTKVLVINSDFSDFAACTFWLPPNAALATYQLKTHTTKPWTNAAIYFYAGTANVNGDTGVYQVDNVSLQYVPALPADHSDCVDPRVPAPPGGAAGPNLLTNGDFGTGSLAPWTTFGTVTAQVTGNVLQMIRPTGTLPAGVVLQPTAQALTSGQIITSTFQLGNSSGVRKRVTAIMHDQDFSDLVACVFWLEPGQALGTYGIVGWTSKAWTNATMAFYAATIGPDQWTLVDNVVYQTTPATATTGSTCLESPPGGASVPNPATTGVVQVVRATPPQTTQTTVMSSARTSAWEAITDAANAATLTSQDDIDLRRATSAHLTFRSWLPSGVSRASVQVRTAGSTWQRVTIPTVSDTVSDTWQLLDIDLAPYVGDVIEIRFVFDPDPIDAADSDAWRLDNIHLEIDPQPGHAGVF